MAASSEVFCSLCEASNLFPKAVQFCPECDVYLCSDCKMHHGMSRLFKLHTSIPIQEYQRLPTVIKSITPFCEEHEQRLDFYCYDHRQPGCMHCILSAHKECAQISLLLDAIKNIKDSTVSGDLEQTLTDLTSFIEKIKNVLKQNKNGIIIQKSNIIDQIRVIREQIITHLNSLERNMIDKLSTLISTHVKDIDSLLQEIDAKKTTLLQLSEDWKATKKYASEFQSFLGIRRLETDIEKEEQYLRSLSTNGSLDAKTFELVPKRIDNGTLDLSIFGDIQISKISTKIALTKEKEKQAQIGTLISKSIDKISLNIKRQIRINNQPDGNIINGSTMLPNGDFVLAEYNVVGWFSDRVIRVTGESESCVTKWEFIPNGEIYNVSVINENTIAISGCYCRQPELYVVDFNTDTIINTLETDRIYYSITSNESKIIGIRSSGIYSTDITSNCTNLIMSDRFQLQSGIAVFMEKIFVTTWNGSVVCCEMSGKIEWKFKEEALLKKPAGIAVDNHGNVFVADEESDSVVVISPCASRCRQVLGKTDGLSKPRSLYFSRKHDCLLVCNSREDVFVCNISYI